jgi:hypothetical protein
MARRVTSESVKRRAHLRSRSAAPYVLIVRGADGRLRAERFSDAAAYRVRLSSLEHERDGAVSLPELISLLDI